MQLRPTPNNWRASLPQKYDKHQKVLFHGKSITLLVQIWKMQTYFSICHTAHQNLSNTIQGHFDVNGKVDYKPKGQAVSGRDTVYGKTCNLAKQAGHLRTASRLWYMFLMRYYLSLIAVILRYVPGWCKWNLFNFSFVCFLMSVFYIQTPINFQTFDYCYPLCTGYTWYEKSHLLKHWILFLDKQHNLWVNRSVAITN